ncbi:PREDICTED: transmembrane and immunoglobulin domain-containing protein 2 [Condylura cristata]|uniref:transmembrane and immunoglobulin domain-containing protein 2 n=1 Tax=Condylura cristata TaxID=143302 RepID=UPI0006431F81|nr:PREDICTED: transmembrane and immunoglobulin domain-containing protein 2 [Condylura cristata]
MRLAGEFSPAGLEAYPAGDGLQGATGLGVQQLGPTWLVVRQGSQVTLACCVTQAQAWELMRAEWTKDNDTLCQSLITHEDPKMEVCGPWGQLSWQPRSLLTLRLERVDLNDSGHYTCRMTMEIPDLEEAKGNGTELQVKTDGPLDRHQISSFAGEGCPGSSLPNLSSVRPPTSSAPPGKHPALLLGCVAVVLTAIALGVGTWSRRRRRGPWESENPLYSNVLVQQGQTPKKTEARAAEGRALGIPREDQRPESFYSTSVPQLCKPRLNGAPSPGPRPRSQEPHLYSRNLP